MHIPIATMVLATTMSGPSQSPLVGLDRLPELPKAPLRVGRAPFDWLIEKPRARARIYRSAEGKSLVLDNGLIRRVIRLDPAAATTGLDNLMTGESMLRAVSPEGWIEADGRRYAIGGLSGQPDRAYLLPEWIEAMKPEADSFVLTGFTTGKTAERMEWERTVGDSRAPWPPPGVSAVLTFAAQPGGPSLSVEVRYELYDGMPVIAKQIVVRNVGDRPVRVDRFASEVLALVEAESAVGEQPVWRLPNVHVASDFMFGGDTPENASRVVHWLPDPAYGTQVNYGLTMPAILECRPPLGPAIELNRGEELESFRTFLLLFDGTDRERNGLAVRRMYRALAPWTCDSPLMLHLTSTDETVVRTAMDQAADVGFEMVIFSFGSGLNMEDVSPANIARFKAYADYARAKGLRVGGYSLLASRRISDEHDVIHPKTGKPGGAIFGNSPCLASAWGIEYFQRIRRFLSETGFALLEHDGSYPGDVCASTSHPGHRGLEDSQWVQYRMIAEFYAWCRSRGIFLNVPDWYYLAGSNKSGMGYRETNWSLPRAQQHIHARQNLFDGTWQKTPTMGWMFTPLVEYQGGGAAATIEPLREHLADYELHLTNNLLYGAQACYRGPRLYDSEETRALVIKWVTFFKKHRAILESDVIHLRRADGVHPDGILHVNPELDEKGLAVFWNPSNKAYDGEVVVPLRYTGITDTALISHEGARPVRRRLDSDRTVRVKVSIPARGVTWLVIKG
ncbi:MAG: alpha-galactosidase [Chthonomonadales bacterium]|nr:alpha-galactosidase [Chthonomonadales bacterium]